MRYRVVALAGLAVALASFGGSVLGLTLPAVASDFRAPVPALTHLGAALQLGTVLALPLAALADRVGRRHLLAAGVAGCSLAALGSAAAPSLAGLALGRIAGVGFEALVAGVATAMVVEETPAERRALAVSALTFAAGAGIGVTTIVYPLVAPHWRLLYSGAAACLPLAPLLWWALPESRGFTEARHRGGVGILLQPPYRGRLLLLAAYSVASIGVLDPAALFAVLFGSRTLAMAPTELSAVVVASGLVGIVCFGAGGWVADRYGRRVPGVLLSAATALGVTATFLSTTRLGYWGGNLAWSGFASAGAPVLGAWFAELFPTRARATSEAWLAVTGAAGALLGLQLLGDFEPGSGLGRTLAAGGFVGVAAAGLLLRLPETKGAPLPE